MQVRRFPSVLSWQFLALLAVTASVLLAVFQFFNYSISDLALMSALFPASFAVLALTLYTRPFARYAEVKLLGVFLLWVVVVLFINDYRIANAFKSKWFYCMCVTSFLLFPFAYGLPKEQAAKALSAIAAALLIGVTLFASLGLVQVASLVSLPQWLTQGELMGIGPDGRLWMLCHPNTFGPICGGAILLGGYLFARTRRALPKVLVAFAALICFTALALTDSRTAILATALGIALEAFLATVLLLPKRKAVLRVVIALAAAAAAYSAFAQGSVLVRAVYPVPAQSQAQAQPSNTVAAPAPVPVEAPISSRDLRDIDTFNGRTGIWLGTLKGIQANPSILLTGTSPLISGKLMDPYFPPNAPDENIHNTYLAWLVAYGVPGVLLLLAFLGLLATASVKLTFGALFDRSSLAVRMIPAMLLFALAESMMEVFLFVDGSLDISWVFLMLGGGYVFRLTKAQ